MGVYEELFTAAFREEPYKEPTWISWKHILQGLTHCPACLKLDKCWFKEDKTPLNPQRDYCHCTTDPIPLSLVLSGATSECSIHKFRDFVFDPRYAYKGKGDLFEKWGYSKEDSEFLRQELKRQALEQYTAGQYTLGKLNKDGQRLSIRIELWNRIKKEKVSFISGWMVEPNGKIRCTTPYEGK